MAARHNELELLLLSKNGDLAENVGRTLQHYGPPCIIRSLRPSRRAVDGIRRLRTETRTRGQLILFDFSAATEQNFEFGMEIACGPNRLAIPVVFLTSPDSEVLLEDAGPECCDTTMFAPIPLDRFIAKMLEHSEQRFLRALSLIYELGPIVVRLPASYLHQSEDQYALSA